MDGQGDKELMVAGLHPSGEGSRAPSVSEPLLVDSFAGRIEVLWAPDEAITALGQLSFFVDFLKQSDLFEGLVAGCSASVQQSECAGRQGRRGDPGAFDCERREALCACERVASRRCHAGASWHVAGVQRRFGAARSGGWMRRRPRGGWGLVWITLCVR